jgi:hypothetical protein
MSHLHLAWRSLTFLQVYHSDRNVGVEEVVAVEYGEITRMLTVAAPK